MNSTFVLKNKPNVLYTDYFFYGLIGISILLCLLILYSFLVDGFNFSPFASFLGGLVIGGIGVYAIMIKRKPLRGKKEIAELMVSKDSINFKILFNKTYSNLTCSLDEIHSAVLNDTFFTVKLKNGEELNYFAANLNFKDRKQLQDHIISKVS
jgi:hypothetical protein